MMPIAIVVVVVLICGTMLAALYVAGRRYRRRTLPALQVGPEALGVIARLAAVDHESPTIDRPVVEEAFRQYFAACRLPARPVRWVNSAEEGMLAAHAAQAAGPEEQVAPLLDPSDRTFPAWEQAFEQALLAARVEVDDAVWTAVWEATKVSVEPALRVTDFGVNPLDHGLSPREHPAWERWLTAVSARGWSAGHLAALAAAERVLAQAGRWPFRPVHHWPRLAPFVEAFAAGLWCFWLRQTEVIAVPRPRLKIEDGVLHCAHGAAVFWPSAGVDYFFLDGIQVTARVVRTLETLGRPGSDAGEQQPASEETQTASPIERSPFRMLVKTPAMDEGVWKTIVIDPGAATADPSRPAFMARPPGARPYHGHPLLQETRTEGWCYGAISDPLEQDCDAGCTIGEGFVEAPDGRRAGVMWRVDRQFHSAVVKPPAGARWGVFFMILPWPIRALHDLREAFRAIVPALKQRYQDVLEGEDFQSFPGAVAALNAGRTAEAQERFLAVLAAVPPYGSWGQVAAKAAQAYRDVGRVEDGRVFVQQALEIREGVREGRGWLNEFLLLARFAREWQLPADEERLLRRALEFIEANGHESMMGGVLAELASVLRAQGKEAAWRSVNRRRWRWRSQRVWNSRRLVGGLLVGALAVVGVAWGIAVRAVPLNSTWADTLQVRTLTLLAGEILALVALAILLALVRVWKDSPGI